MLPLNSEYAWQSRPFKSRQLRRKGKGKGKGKGGFKGTKRAFLGEEQAQDPAQRSEDDVAWWSKGKRSKKSCSKGNESLEKNPGHSCEIDNWNSDFTDDSSSSADAEFRYYT